MAGGNGQKLPFSKLMSQKQSEIKNNIQKMVNDEDQAVKFFRYLGKLKKKKEEQKIEELK